MCSLITSHLKIYAVVRKIRSNILERKALISLSVIVHRPKSCDEEKFSTKCGNNRQPA